MIEKRFKASLLAHLKSLVQDKIDSLESEISAMTSSRDTASKSTAGDKHETGRAMMQMELDNLQMQLGKERAILSDLKKIDPELNYEQVGLGSMVRTDKGLYFLSVGMGRITFEANEIFVISLASPIGKAMQGKRVGEELEFNGRVQQVCALK